jgi:hypothetical protein
MLERNRLVGKQPAAAAKSSGYLELYVRGTAGQEEFGLREIDAADKEVVSLVVKDATLNGAMLAKVLARTKADSTAPTEVRLLVDPRASLGWGPLAILKACDAAGYKTVKFTGYVPAGGFTRQLKPDEKGEMPGYKRYDGIERKVRELMKEIEDGMRTF